MTAGVATQNRPFQTEVRMKKIRIERPEISPARNPGQTPGKNPLGPGFLGLLILTYLISAVCLCWIFYVRSKF